MDKCARASCEWKYVAPSSLALQKWHSGSVCVQHSDSYCWHLDLYETFNSDRTSHNIKLAGEITKLVVQRERILVNFRCGSCSMRFKTEAEKMKIVDVLKPLETGTCSLHSGLKCLTSRTKALNGAKVLDSSVKPSHVPGYSRMTNVTPVKESRKSVPHSSSALLVKMPTSSNQYTRVKDHNVSPFDELLEDASPSDKDLHDSGRESTHKTKFIECSQAKANKSLTSSDFYGSRSASAHINGAFGSAGFKRKPGFLSLNENENKKPRVTSGLLATSKTQPALDDMAFGRQTTTLLGFSNLGNTCYMNSVLQALFCLVPFASDLQTVARSGFSSGPGGILCRTMASLLQTPLQVDTSVDRGQLLTKIKGLIAKKSKCFSGHEQHDAHEFLNRILDQLKEEVNALTVANKQNGSVASIQNGSVANIQNGSVANIQNGSVANIQNGSSQQKGSEQNSCNLIVQNFEGEMRQTITCTNCKQDSYKNVIVNDISLVVTSGSKRISIQDRIRNYFKPNIIEYTCTRCNYDQALLTDKFLRLPRIVILLLKRYQCNSFSNRKIVEDVIIPRYITFSEHCNQDTCPPTKLGASPYEGNNILWLSHQSKPLLRMRFKERFLDNSKEGRRLSEVESSLADEDHGQLGTGVNEERLSMDVITQEMDGSVQKSADSPAFATKVNSRYYDEEDLKMMSDSDQLEAALNLSRSELQTNDHSYDGSVKKNITLLGESSSLKVADPCNGDSQTSPDLQQREATPFGAKGSNWSKPLTPDRPTTLSARALKQRISKELFPTDCDLKLDEAPLPLLDTFDTTEDKENMLPSYADCEPGLEWQPMSEVNRGQTEEEFDAELKRAIELSLQSQEMEEDAERLLNFGDEDNGTSDELLVDASEMAELEELKKAAETGELPNSYRLMSVVNHFGSNTSLGHYVTDIYDINSNQWYTCDDSHISFTSEESVLKTRKKTGYILFYLSKDLEDEIKKYRRSLSLHC